MLTGGGNDDDDDDDDEVDLHLPNVWVKPTTLDFYDQHKNKVFLRFCADISVASNYELLHYCWLFLCL